MEKLYKINQLTISYMSPSKIPTHYQNILFLPPTPLMLQYDTFCSSKFINPKLSPLSWGSTREIFIFLFNSYSKSVS